MTEITINLEHVLHGIIILTSAISLMGSGFVLIMYIKVKYLRTFSFKLVALLSLFNFLVLTNLFLQKIFWVEIEENSNICLITAYFNLSFSLSSQICTCIIAWAVYLTVIRRDIDIESYFLSFLCLIIVFPLLYAILPHVFNRYGSGKKLNDENTECYFKKDD